MKAIYFGIILAMITGVCYQVSNCPNDNPWISYIKDSKVEKVRLLPNPVLESSHCGEEWKIYGTCCEKQSLITYANMEHMHFKQYSERVFAQFSHFENAIGEVFNWITRLAFMPTLNCWFKDKILSAQEFLKNKQNLAFFDKYLLRPQADMTEFKKQTEACWVEFVAKARTASLCGICSARSNLFFKNGKGLIDENSCFSFMDHCHKSMELIAYYMDSLYHFIPIAKQAQSKFEMYVSLSANIYEDKVIDAWKELDTSRIKESLAAYNPSEPATVINLCNKFIRLGTKTLIQYVAETVSGNNVWVVNPHEYIKEYYKVHRSEIDAAVRKWKARQTQFKTVSNWVRRRRLQSDITLLEMNFFSDIEVQSNIDSSYTSYYGANGTSNHGRGFVFNLTCAFP